MTKCAAILLMIGIFASPATAEDRDFCADRPGQATPPCTVEPGRVMVEAGLVDWTRSHDASARTDSFTLGDFLVRTGVTQSAEIQIGWAALGFARTRDRATGAQTHDRGTGDVTVALQKTLGAPDAPIAIRGFVTLPTGGGPLGAGDWGAGAMVPMAFNLSDSVELDLTPEVDAAVNARGDGRHLAYGSVFGLGFKLSDAWNLAVDAALFRDRDPSGVTTSATMGASLAWMANRNLQLDIGTVAGLNRDTPDIETYFGVVRRF